MRTEHLRTALILLMCVTVWTLEVSRPWTRNAAPASTEWREYWAAMAQGNLPACAASGNRHCLAVPHF